tara:strand:- start:1745 stop:2560 length:816 start_codon:yes stop_codon:yes gene_type:complete
MNTSTPLRELRAKYRTDFVDYDSYLTIATSSLDNPDLGKILNPSSHYESISILKDSLAESLDHRKDKKELIGLAANQVGIPISAVYFEYYQDGVLKNSLLTDPEIKAVDKETPRLFLKLVKCPNSPSPYHIGIFNMNIAVASSNSPTFTLKVAEHIDSNGLISANLQRIIWASKGYLPGDSGELPMNYYNVSKAVESSEKLKSLFNCWIHKDEIDLILSKFKIVDHLGLHTRGAFYLHQNLINLASQNLDKEWIRIPGLDLFKDINNLLVN